MLGRNPTKTGNEDLSIGMALPFVLALLAILAVLGAIATVSSSYTDDEAVTRQSNLVANLLEDQKKHIRLEQEEMIVWDSAAEAVYGSELDIDFIDDNLGTGAFEFFGHDEVYVLDAKLNPVYAMRDGEMVPAPVYENVRDILEPFGKKLRDINWRGALEAFASGRSETPPSVQDVLLLGDMPTLVNFMPILSDRVGASIPPGREFIHVVVQYFDDDVAAEFRELLLIETGHFTVDPAISSEAAVAVKNSAGTPIVYYAWEPYLPSASALKKAGPAIFIALALGTTLITVLMVRLHRTAKELRAGRFEAQHMAFHDALTGLGNRITFEKSLAAAIKLLGERHSEAVAFLMLDLDRFKQVNDTLGHEAGDELIREVAARLRPLVRTNDTIVRLGGDEFGIVASGVTSADDLAALSKRILAAIGAPFELGAGQAFVGVSIGISLTRDPKADPVELTRDADIALYAAKEGGRNQFRIFEEYMSESVRARQTLEADLRAALRTDDQLDVHFEPLIRETSGDIFGSAAQIHWNHPTRGTIPAAEYMPLAETCGLSEIIGEYVLHQACKTGIENPSQLMVVRAYSAQLRNPQFFDKVFSILNNTGMRPQNLELEVDEKTLSTSEETVVVTLRKLRHAGIRIALADFGTGFTSLRLLQKFQVDRIKMDRSFINELEQSPDPEAITHAVIWLARAIGVEVSAEGVDTASKRDFLARMGCTSFQGALFTPEGQAEALLNAISSADDPNSKTAQPDDGMDVEVWKSGA